MAHSRWQADPQGTPWNSNSDSVPLVLTRGISTFNCDLTDIYWGDRKSTWVGWTDGRMLGWPDARMSDARMDRWKKKCSDRESNPKKQKKLLNDLDCLCTPPNWEQSAALATLLDQIVRIPAYHCASHSRYYRFGRTSWSSENLGKGATGTGDDL